MGLLRTRVPTRSPFLGPSYSPVLCHCPQDSHRGDGRAGWGCGGDGHHGRRCWAGWDRPRLAQCCAGCRRGRGRGTCCCAGRRGGPVWQMWTQSPGPHPGWLRPQPSSQHATVCHSELAMPGMVSSDSPTLTPKVPPVPCLPTTLPLRARRAGAPPAAAWEAGPTPAQRLLPLCEVSSSLTRNPWGPAKAKSGGRAVGAQRGQDG